MENIVESHNTALPLDVGQQTPELENKPEKKPDLKSKKEVSETIESLAKTLVGKMPDVQQHVLKNLPPEKPLEGGRVYNVPEGVKDRFGRTFDPRLHLVDEQGKAILTKKGKLYCKVRTPEEFQPAPPSVPEQVSIEQEKLKIQRLVAAELLTTTVLNLSIMTFGEEWYPEANEKEMLVSSTELYLEAKNVGDFPPGICLCIIWGMYAAKRLPQPKTKSRLAQIKEWIVIKFLRFKNRKGLKSVSYSDSRDNRERKNDTSEEASENVQKSRDTGFNFRPFARS